jgi:hypothetical protein
MFPFRRFSLNAIGDSGHHRDQSLVLSTSEDSRIDLLAVLECGGSTPLSSRPFCDKHSARSFLSFKVALHGGRNGVGSRFRPTIYHMGSGSPENDSRPLPPDSTKKYMAGCLALICLE